MLKAVTHGGGEPPPQGGPGESGGALPVPLSSFDAEGLDVQVGQMLIVLFTMDVLRAKTRCLKSRETTPCGRSRSNFS